MGENATNIYPRDLFSVEMSHNRVYAQVKLRVQSNLYITVTLGKWPGDRYIQGDRCTQVSFKLLQNSINSIFCANNHSIYV